MRTPFLCYRVDSSPGFEASDPRPAGRLDIATIDELPVGEVTIRVGYSSINYKDALAACGHPGVVRRFPHVPGIDASGTVVESRTDRFAPGDQVIVTGNELGSGRWGGWAEFIRVPTEWIVPCPPTLDIQRAMTLGTAGFTAAQAVMALERHEIEPGTGPVLVTGATGGVGCIAVMLLAQLGYEVAVVTGKPHRADWLRELGASAVHGREVLQADESRALRSARWAGVIDTVGGPPLAAVLSQVRHRGCVATCGMVAGHRLDTTVYPFILRGVRLEGIDSALCPAGPRREIWRRLADEWRLDRLDRVATIKPLDQVPQVIESMLRGESVGRVVLEIKPAADSP